MVKVNRLRARMVELGMSVEAVAEHMGLDKSTLYRRLQSPDSLSVKEVGLLTQILCLPGEDALDIFFS